MRTLSMACQAAGAFLLAGCQKGEETIKIGMAGVQTGADGQIGTSMMNGSQVAIDEWNAKGGLLGKKIEVISLDDEGNPAKAVTVAQTLVDDGVVAVIGHFNSGCTIPASRLYNDAKILEISAGSTNPQYTDQGFPYAFRMCGRDDQQGQIAGQFLFDQMKLTKLAILDDKTAYGEGLAEEVKKTFEAKGGQVVMFQGIGKDDRDFRANLAVVKGVGAQAFFWGGMYGQGGALEVQLRQEGLPIPFVSGDGCYDQAFIDTIGGNAANVFLTFGRDYHTPAAQPFMDAYKKKYGQEVGSYSVYGYDAANCLFTGIQNAGTTDAAKVAAVMKSTTFQTTLGPIEFDAKGDVKEAGYIIWTVKDGKLAPMGG